MFELSRIECGRVNDMQTRGSRGRGGGGLGEGDGVVREGGRGKGYSDYEWEV